MDYLDKARRVIQLEVDELNRLVDRVGDSFRETIDCLLNALEDRGKIIVAGVGKSGNIGNKLAATLNSTGAPAIVLDCQDALHGDLGLVDRDDVVIALSYSGETNELLDVLPHLKRRSAKVIALTGFSDSGLGRAADYVIDINVEREACPLNLAPTSSTTNMLVMGDALAMVLLEARRFGKDDFAELHPAGSLGRALLTRVTDIMRQGEQLAVIPPEMNIGDALEVMIQVRAGAVIVTNGSGTLEGIFTQGDFARAFQKNPADIAEQPVSEFMTRDPISIRDDKLAAEALRLLEENRIDDLVVVNEKNEPLGLIDTQDLTRLRVL